MLAESTIRKAEQQLYELAKNLGTDQSADAAYFAATALQWARGGCDWNIFTVIYSTLMKDGQTKDSA